MSQVPAAAPPDEAREHGLRWDIQALRGLAVLWVLLHHAQLPGVPAGYLGVDIFFVISGFLITGLIQRAQDAGRFSWREFYWRRARRLLPAAYLTLAVCALLAPWLLNALELQDYRQQQLGALLFGSNLVLWLQSGYFEGAAELKPLLHFWSLSVEEQYYLLLPALLLWLGRGRRLLGITLLGLLSLLGCLWLARLQPSAAFYLLPTRAWELALGSLGALLMAGRRPSPAWLAVWRWPAMAVLLLAPLWPAPGQVGPHPGLLALLVDLATLALLCAAAPSEQGRAARLLRPLRWLGDCSYSLYLLHWPLLAALNNAWVGPTSAEAMLPWRLAALLLCLPLAWAMWRWVELPPRRWALPLQARAWLAIAAASAVLALLPWWSQLQPALPQAGQDYATLRRPNHGLAAACDHEQPFSGTAPCRTAVKAGWMVWGDSYAMALVPGLAPLAPGLLQATKSSCGPLLGLVPFKASVARGETFARPWSQQCQAFNASVLAYLAGDADVDVVVLSSLLEQYVDGTRYQALQGEQLQAASVDAALLALRHTVQALRRLGKRVILIAPPPSAGFDSSACLERQALRRWTLGTAADCSLDRQAASHYRAAVQAFLDRAEREADVPVLRFEPALCDEQRCRTAAADGLPYYRDLGHLSIEGAQRLLPALGWGAAIAQQSR
ncbi:acyltransferase family protein [Paucibacter sp. APW11]|uniref:Acyltransferase family protein n=1 Tax=Roseateles aquae TaxID=3077235 RepID=A0ABU3PHB7_9BURK|nr:acyltransferase family protein [Paucibacter sp. APW11]MDT9001965.1 acyltransferase family protein [Paucibacter sp. APW11]